MQEHISDTTLKKSKNIIHCTTAKNNFNFCKPKLHTDIKMYVMQYINYASKMSILTIQIPQKSNESII